jgi:protein SCO1/2
MSGKYFIIICKDFLIEGHTVKFLIKLLPLFVFMLTTVILPEGKKIDIGIDEQLGKYLPLNLYFNDETGDRKILDEYIKGPTVLAFVYYECPGICSPLMTSIAEVVNKVDMKPGENYNIITISIDEFEKPPLAADKKQNYMKLIKRKFPESRWRFLTGDSASIKTVTDSAGFYFKREGTQFIHSGAVLFISGDGKICRYLYPSYSENNGYSILPFDFKMAITETSQGVSTPTIARVLQLCFSYDPEGKTYVLNLTRIFGVGILFMAVVFVLYITIKPKKKVKSSKR